MYQVEEKNGKVFVNGKERVELCDTMPNDWHVDKGATTAPRGYKWITNGKSLFNGERKSALIREENLHYPILTAEQLRDEILAETAELIAEAKEKGYYYPEMCTDREYTSVRGKHCYKTFGGESSYFLKCAQLGITPKCLASGLHYEAQGDGFALEYVEHDIILAMNN